MPCRLGGSLLFKVTFAPAAVRAPPPQATRARLKKRTMLLMSPRAQSRAAVAHNRIAEMNNCAETYEAVQTTEPSALPTASTASPTIPA